jgi:hypothetical protein
VYALEASLSLLCLAKEVVFLPVLLITKNKPPAGAVDGVARSCSRGHERYYFSAPMTSLVFLAFYSLFHYSIVMVPRPICLRLI